ncbi:MAG: hypothetical protein RL260_3910, partial [Pseudomonadota bacterium]
MSKDKKHTGNGLNTPKAPVPPASSPTPPTAPLPLTGPQVWRF